MTPFSLLSTLQRKPALLYDIQAWESPGDATQSALAASQAGPRTR